MHHKIVVNLYSWKGFITRELSISSFKYVVSDFFAIYCQNFEMIFLNWYNFLSSRCRDLKIYWYRENKSICYDSWERESWALTVKIYGLQLCFHLGFHVSKLRFFVSLSSLCPCRSSKEKSISALAHCSRVIFLQNLKEQTKFENPKKNFGVSFQTLNSIFFKNSKH